MLSYALRDAQYARIVSSLDCSEGSEDTTTSPWSEFCAAGAHSAAGRNEEAITLLRGIIEAPGQEPRPIIEAWDRLRQLGVEPSDDQARQVFGVVYEYGGDGGLDLLSAFSDHTVRYFSYAGGGVMWEPADADLLPFVDRLLSAAQAIADVIGVHPGELPDPPEQGWIRLAVLTSGGLRFGEGEAGVLAADPMGGRAISAAVDLINELGRRQGDQ